MYEVGERERPWRCRGVLHLHLIGLRKEVLDRLPNLKIATRATGYEHRTQRCAPSEAKLINSVFAEEHDLRNLVVIITPHSAVNTREAVDSIAEAAAADIAAFLAGRPQNLVGKAKS